MACPRGPLERIVGLQRASLDASSAVAAPTRTIARTWNECGR
jgi:hypothetical protein